MRNALSGDAAWRDHLSDIITFGSRVAPRNQPTLELMHTKNIVIDMSKPVVTTPERKLNYRFMIAEALWILAGDNRLEPLTRFVKRMEEFSDDGETLFGAYGPQVNPQLGHVTRALLWDRDTRQAALTIWRRNPPRSRDIPCTVAMVFSIRDDKLHQHVFMRSSDAWLGIPYDMFSFALIGLRVCAAYNAVTRDEVIRPGALTISMTSAHLYERDLAVAEAVLNTPEPKPIEPVPESWLMSMETWNELVDDLTGQREGEPALYWDVNPRSKQ